MRTDRYEPARAGVRRLAFASAVVLLAAACDRGATAPADGPDRSRPPASERLSVEWLAVACDLVAEHRGTPPEAARLYAYVSVAEWTAWTAAEAASPGGAARRAPSPRSAAARAAVEVLAAFYPDARPRLEAMLAEQREVRLAAGELPLASASGETLGRTTAGQLLVRAAGDGASAAYAGQLPTGPELWTNAHPLLPRWGQVRPWLVSSAAAFRAPPPPAYSSPEFRAALDEVRAVAEGRTPAQLATALQWGDTIGTHTPAGSWNRVALGLFEQYRVDEADAVRALAVVNMTMADAMVVCWESKYTYLVRRPFDLEPTLVTPIGRPNHPSYPSGHSCVSGAAAQVLGVIFPAEARRLNDMATEASISRLYGSIHYRFDLEAGLEIGHRVAALASAVRRPPTDAPAVLAVR